MKKLLFPVTFRGHLARQKLLLDKLDKHFDLIIEEYPIDNISGDMGMRAVKVAQHYRRVLDKVKPDITLIRGDRFEVLPIAMLAAYKGGRVVHIEGGDLSGAIDNKVRHAISQLSDFHFVTNRASFARVVSMGANSDGVFDFGSLDVEFAFNCRKAKRLIKYKYVVVSFHPIEGEDGSFLKELMPRGHEVVWIKSNKDFATTIDGEEYAPQEYISLLRHADCLIGNSSSFLKEASIFGTSVVDIGLRQISRLKPLNVLHVPYDKLAIKNAIDTQLGRVYPPDFVYFKHDTSKSILDILKIL